MRKVLINLHSEQLLPNYAAILAEKPDEVYALVTPQFFKQVRLLERMTGVPHTSVPIDPYDFPRNIAVVKELQTKLNVPTDIVVNCTGGTKIMAIAAVFGTISSSSDYIRRFIYLDTQKASFEEIQVGGDGQISSPRIIPVGISIPFDTYLKLRGESLSSVDKPSLDSMRKRKQIGEFLLSLLSRGFFSKQHLFVGKNSPKYGDFSFRLTEKGCTTTETATFKWSPRQAELHVRDMHMVVEAPNQLFFFGGGWLEELSYLSLLDSGEFDQVLHNVVLDLPQNDKNFNKTNLIKNEIDVVVTKGIRAALIECKAGRVLQTDVYRLSAIRNHLLGPFGVAALVTRFPPVESVLAKAKDNRIAFITFHPDCNLPQRILSLFS